MNEKHHIGRTRNIPAFIQPIENVVIWENLFTPDECDSIIAFGELGEFMKARIGEADDGIEDKGIRDTDITWIEPDNDSGWIFDRMAELISKVNFDKYQLELTRFDGFQYSVYNEGGHYDWHVDTQDMPREDGVFRKLSVSVMLSDPEDYEGGELALAVNGNPELKPKKGSAVFFYSFINHTVKPVTKGTRTALVTWALGPKFV